MYVFQVIYFLAASLQCRGPHHISKVKTYIQPIQTQAHSWPGSPFVSNDLDNTHKINDNTLCRKQFDRGMMSLVWIELEILAEATEFNKSRRVPWEATNSSFERAVGFQGSKNCNELTLITPLLCDHISTPEPAHETNYEVFLLLHVIKCSETYDVCHFCMT